MAASLLVLRNSRWRYGVFLLGSLVFVAAGVFSVFAEGRVGAWIGWSSILFFGGCSLVFVQQIIDTRTRLELNERGIFDRTLGVGLIPWSDVESAYVLTIHQQSFVCLQLRNEDEWVDRLGATQRRLMGANRALGFQAFNINLSGLGAHPQEVLEIVLKMSALPR